MRRLLVAALLILSVRPALAETGAEQELARRALAEAAAACNRIELWGDQSALRRRMAPLLARLDPAAAQRLLPAMRRLPDNARASVEIAVELTKSDPAQAKRLLAAAVARAREMPSSFQREHELRMIALETASAGLDVQGTLALTRALKDPWLTQEVMERLAERDASALLKEGQKSGTPAAERELVLAAVAPHLARSNLDRGLGLLDLVESPRLKSQVLQAIGRDLPPQEALGLALRVPDEWLRCNLLAAAAVRVSESDPDLAAAGTDAMPAWRDSALASVAAAVAPRDRAKAVEIARAIPQTRIRADALRGTALASYAQDPHWADRLLGEAGMTVETRAELAHRYQTSGDLLASEARAFAQSEAAAQAAERDPQAALGLAARIEDDFLRFRAVRAAALSLARQSLDKATSALGLLVERRRIELLRAEAAAAAARPEDGVALLREAPVSETRARSLVALAARQMESSPERAVETARLALPEENGLRWLAWRLAKTDPERAFGLAMQIESPDLRTYALIELAEALLGAPEPEEDKSIAGEVWRIAE